MTISKKANYILVPLAILVWGTAVYRVLQALGKGENERSAWTGPKPGPDRLTVASTWTDSLLLDYADPFRMDAVYAAATAPVPASAIEGAAPLPYVEEVPWPEIRYLGEMGTVQGGTKVVLLQINGRSRMLRKGDVVEGIRLLATTDKGAKVEYMGKKKEVLK